MLGGKYLPWGRSWSRQRLVIVTISGGNNFVPIPWSTKKTNNLDSTYDLWIKLVLNAWIEISPKDLVSNLICLARPLELEVFDNLVKDCCFVCWAKIIATMHFHDKSVEAKIGLAATVLWSSFSQLVKNWPNSWWFEVFKFHLLPLRFIYGNI